MNFFTFSNLFNMSENDFNLTLYVDGYMFALSYDEVLKRFTTEMKKLDENQRTEYFSFDKSSLVQLLEDVHTEVGTYNVNTFDAYRTLTNR